MEFITEFFRNFLQVLTGIAPWLLTGFFVSGLIALLLPPGQIKHHLGGRGFKSVLKAVLLGVPLPICSCGVVPVATALRQEGADKGATGAFYISTPQTGVDSMLVTWSLIGLPMALIRVAVAALSGLTGGLLINRWGGRDASPAGTLHAGQDCCCASMSANKSGRGDLSIAGGLKFVLNYGFIKMVKRMAPTLTFGIAAAALIQQLVPENFGAEYIGGNPVLEFAVIILFALPLYVCSTASVPVAAALMLKGFSPGAALIFMIAGPAANSVSITSMKSLLGTRAMLLAMGSIIFWTLSAGTLVNVFHLPFELSGAFSPEHGAPVWRSVCAAVLALLLLKGLVERKILDPLRERRKQAEKQSASTK